MGEQLVQRRPPGPTGPGMRGRDVGMARFVLACQQLLTLLVVVAIIAPAANLVTLDIVAPPVAGPASRSGAGPAAAPAAHR